MAHTYHPQSDHPEPTLTVGELIETLQGFDRTRRVIFRSPKTGCFGSGQTYSIEGASVLSLPKREMHFPGGTRSNEETGEPETYEPFTLTWNAWDGVVIG